MAFSTVKKTLPFRIAGLAAVASSLLMFPGTSLAQAVGPSLPLFEPAVTAPDAIQDVFPAPVGFRPGDISPSENTDISTMITTGCGYDAWTGAVRRQVTDLEVPSTVGSHGLKVVRTYSSSNGVGWAMSWHWQIHFHGYGSTDYMVSMPDGRTLRFTPTGSQPYRSSVGTKERLYSSSFAQDTGTADLWLEDGSVVHFFRITDYIDSTGQPVDTFKPETFTDPFGRVTTITTVQYGSEYWHYHITKVTDPSGRYLTFNYDTNQVLQSIMASTGESVNYNGNDVTYADGTSAHYTFGTTTYKDPVIPGQINAASSLFTADDVRAEGPMQAIKYTYRTSAEFQGQVSEEQSISGTMVSHLDATNKPDSTTTTNTETRGDGPFSRTFKIDKVGQVPLLKTKSDFEGMNESFLYDGNNYLQTFTDRNQKVTSYVNEPILGRPTTITHPGGAYPDGTSFPTSTEAYTYSFGGVISSSNPYFVASRKDDNGKVTYYDRDSNNRIYQIRYPDGATEGFVYNSLGLVTRHQRRNGYYEFIDYDGSGRLTAVWNPVTGSTHPTSGPKTSYSYYNAPHVWGGRVQTVTDPRGYHTTYEYDLSFDSATLNQPCSGRGLVTKISYTDDTHGGTVSGGTYKSFGYDVYGNKLWEENEMRQRTTYTYDDYKRILSVKLPSSTQVQNPLTSYDYARPGYLPYSHTTSNWQKTTQLAAPAAAVVTQRLYDANFRKSTETDAYGVAGVAATTYYDYDANGNETKMTDPRGTGLGDVNHTVTATYDSRNRKTRVTNPPVVPAAAPTDYKYDANGNVTSIKRPDGTTELKEYDEMNRVTKDTVPKTTTPTVTNIVTQMQYFPSGTLKQVTDGNSNVTSFLYNGYDLRTTMTYPNLSTQTWTYDDNNNVLEWKNTGGIF